jgi:hypothetical protein
MRSIGSGGCRRRSVVGLGARPADVRRMLDQPVPVRRPMQRFLLAIVSALALAAPLDAATPSPACAQGAGAGEAPASPDAAAAAARNQDSTPQLGQRRSPDISREQMWRRPTEADQAKPHLIQWQRTWEDAQTLARETGKPILVAINMDGEIASEHYAGVLYRDPRVAALFEPYVCVIGSTYRHTPRDHDEQGRRIECPRFGTVTCAEHIALEPTVYELYLDQERVAPRHLMIELDGSEVYDVYYAFDTASVLDAIREGIEDRELEPYPERETDRTIEGLVSSSNSVDRERVESTCIEGDRTVKRALLNASAKLGSRSSIDLLRLALFDVDIELAAEARRQLARTENVAAIDLVLEALRLAMPEAERESLVAALERLGEQSERARTLGLVQRGLAERSSTIDVEAWNRVTGDRTVGGASYDRPDASARWSTKSARLVRASKSVAADPAEQLELAEALLAYAVEPGSWKAAGGGSRPVQGFTPESYVQLMLTDAREAALEARAGGLDDWRTHAALALSHWYLGDRASAESHAGDAVERLPAGVEDWNAMAVLSLFADLRERSIRDAIRAREAWPKDWMSEVHSAYSVLDAHPEADAGVVARHYDFLEWMGAFGPSMATLNEGLERFPLAPELHQRLRWALLRRSGPDGLERHYALRLERVGEVAGEYWFAGLASLMSAESLRKQNQGEAAREVYAKTLSRYAHSVELDPRNAESAAYYSALALAGQARIALEAEDLATASDLLIAAIERHPPAANVLDSLEVSAVETSRTLLERLREGGDQDRLSRVEAALGLLEPEQLQPAAYDQVGPPTRTPDGRRRLDGR